MQLLRCLALAFWLFGLVQCAFLGADLKPAAGITALEVANPNDMAQFAFWRKVIPAPKNPMELTDLYTEASKAFNWLGTQPHARTIERSALVAAFYDHRTQKVYMSTIMRGYLFNDYINQETYGRLKAPLWWQARSPSKRTDAENGAYFYREELGPPVSDRTYGNTKTGKPEGSKIVAWGVHNVDIKDLPKLDGKAQRLCYTCQTVAYKLGVDFDEARIEDYGLLPAPPDTKQPARAPPKKAEERPASPDPKDKEDNAKENPTTPPPKPAGDKAPSSGNSFGGSSVDKKWTKEEEDKMQRLEKSKKNPVTPPPKAAGDKAPSSGSSFGGSSVDKKWTKEEEDKMQRLEKSKKRPPTQSPEDSGKHKPPGPTTPSALVHRPADAD
ncbi:unnamed protein product [Clonostachys chloroleuca]|uniref:Uncharacterized protein n=1 Tax=Clonostachys chloroleuca TaxID=1926264 RepID=A0AA35PW07_9HYPO|nr:unnamed protein product [Clonostachys chloroleuca]